MQSTSSHPTSLRSILILSIHLRLGLAIGLFPSGFPTSILYAFVVKDIDDILAEKNIKIAAISETKKKFRGSKETNNYLQFYHGVGKRRGLRLKEC
jgi:hypothetical protein